MTEKQLKQAKSQLPQGEKFDRCYSAFEGGIRLISKKADGTETRYKVLFDANDNAIIEKF
jgi:predicted small secreted protein